MRVHHSLRSAEPPRTAEIFLDLAGLMGHAGVFLLYAALTFAGLVFAYVLARSPPAKSRPPGQVSGDVHRGLLGKTADQVEQQLAAGLGNWQSAEFVAIRSADHVRRAPDESFSAAC